jgi:hypothetical protein
MMLFFHGATTRENLRKFLHTSNRMDSRTPHGQFCVFRDVTNDATNARPRQATTRAREGERPSGVSTWGKRQADRQAATVAVPSEKNKRRGARAPSGPCWNNSQVISVSSVNAIYWFSSANILLSTRGRFSRDRFTMNIGMNTILVKLY